MEVECTVIVTQMAVDDVLAIKDSGSFFADDPERCLGLLDRGVPEAIHISRTCPEDQRVAHDTLCCVAQGEVSGTEKSS